MWARNFFAKLNKLVILVICVNILYSAISYLNNEEAHAINKRSIPSKQSNQGRKLPSSCVEKWKDCLDKKDERNMIENQPTQNEPPQKNSPKQNEPQQKVQMQNGASNKEQLQKYAQFLGYPKENSQGSSQENGTQSVDSWKASQKQNKILQIRNELENRNRSYDFVPNCTMYKEDLKRTFTHHINVCGIKKPNDVISGDITLLTQLSEMRVESLQRLIKQWTGHVSATLYINDTDKENVTKIMCGWLQSINRNNVQIHLVQDSSVWYHINLMRNIAQENAVTEYVYMCDVDFMIMPNLYENLMKDVPIFFKKHSSFQNVLTIPALMAFENCSFPETKKKVDKEFGNCINRFDYGFPKFKGDPTNYTRWMKANVPYKIPYAFHFEPYLIIKKKHSPRYEETFLQRWYDKMSHVFNLYSAGFQMWVYPHGYMVHMYHESAPINEFLYEKSKHCAGLYLRNCFRKAMVKGQRKLNMEVIDHWVPK